ncbi:MAG: PAS domain-containing protein [Ilumatobacteraceae bacterium]
MKWSRRRTEGGDLARVTSLAGGVVFDLVEQPVFVFAPVFDETATMIDLSFVDMNRAALDDLGIQTAPLGDSVRAWLTDLDLLWTAADRAWRTGRAEPYDLEVRRGSQLHTVRSFTIDTARAGDLIVQVAAPRTDARLLHDERDRFAATLDALDDGVIVLQPVVDGDQVLDARIDFVNAACARFFRPERFHVETSGLRGVGVGEVVENAQVAESILAAVAAAVEGTPTSMVLDNSSGVFPLLAQPAVRLAFARQSTERVIMTVQDVSLSTFAEHQSTLLNEFGRSVVAAVDRPAFVVRLTPTDVVIDEADPTVRAVLGRPLPCSLAEVCTDPVLVDSMARTIRRVIERSIAERDLEVGGLGPLAGSGWTVAPLPGNRAFAVAARPPTDRHSAGSSSV